MNLYEISKAIVDIVENGEGLDAETGEILDMEALDQLEMSFDHKVDNIACLIKSLKAESNAIKEEARALTERARVKDNKAESLKSYLHRAMALKGIDKFETSRCKLYYRSSEKVEVIEDQLSSEWMRLKAEPNKTEIKKALKEGKEVPGAWLATTSNLQVK